MRFLVLCSRTGQVQFVFLKLGPAHLTDLTQAASCQQQEPEHRRERRVDRITATPEPDYLVVVQPSVPRLTARWSLNANARIGGDESIFMQPAEHGAQGGVKVPT